MPDSSIVIDGKKYMWDGVAYSSKEEAEAKMEDYKKDGFEVEVIEQEGQCFLYTRKVVKEIVLDENQQP